MSLIIATGTNIGDRVQNLFNTKEELSKHFEFIAQSDIFESEAVDYLDQPDFYNQVLEFKTPELAPTKTIELLLQLENKLGRVREIDKGPRVIDIDIIFWDTESFNLPNLIVPHPRWMERSFVVLPLQQLPFFIKLEKCFKMPTSFNVNAFPIKK